MESSVTDATPQAARQDLGEGAPHRYACQVSSYDFGIWPS